MRTLIAVLFAVTLLAGCSTDGSDPAQDATTSAEGGGPADTLPVLGAWQSEPIQSGRRLELTLSDDNSYVATDGCVELPGRWELDGEHVVLTPDRDGEVQCGAVADEPVELPKTLRVDGERLVPQGEGPTFTRP